MEFSNNLHIEFAQPEKMLSPVKPVSLTCSSTCNVFVWAINETEDEGLNLQQLKAIVAKGMDQCADLLRDYQWFSPCIAVIDIGHSKKRVFEFNQLAGDQDWHRGRFVVQIASSQKNETVDDISERWLGPLQTASYSPQPIDIGKFKTLLADAIETVKSPTSVDPLIFQRYVNQVRQAMEMNKPEQMASLWEQELITDLNSLLGQSFFEGTNHG